MSAHDPLCLYVGDGPCRSCFRLETARAEARADERAKRCTCMELHKRDTRVRAEVAALREEVARLEARWLARTPSYGALRDRREVLADLRAKVVDEGCTCCGCDHILALIDEAAR